MKSVQTAETLETPPVPRETSSFEDGSGYALLASTARKILEEKDLSKVLRVICEEACRLLQADRSMISRWIDGDEISRTMVIERCSTTSIPVVMSQS